MKLLKKFANHFFAIFTQYLFTNCWWGSLGISETLNLKLWDLKAKIILKATFTRLCEITMYRTGFISCDLIYDMAKLICSVKINDNWITTKMIRQGFTLFHSTAIMCKCHLCLYLLWNDNRPTLHLTFADNYFAFDDTFVFNRWGMFYKICENFIVSIYSEKCLHKANFSVISFELHGEIRSQIDRLYETLWYIGSDVAIQPSIINIYSYKLCKVTMKNWESMKWENMSQDIIKPSSLAPDLNAFTFDSDNCLLA